MELEMHDIVTVSKDYNYKDLEGLKGVITYVANKDSEPRYGVDFMRVIEGITHSLEGKLNRDTGRWFITGEIALVAGDWDK